MHSGSFSQGRKMFDKMCHMFKRKGSSSTNGATHTSVNSAERSVQSSKENVPKEDLQKNVFPRNEGSNSRGESKSGKAGGLGGLLDDNPKYNAIRFLGSGSYGMVVLASNLTNCTPVAIKLIPRGKQIDEKVLREVRNHKRLNHPNVVKFHEVFLTSSHLCIVMDYAPGQNLLKYVSERGYLLEKNARKVFQQLILAVHKCHSMQIVNRDIKLDNTLLDNGDPPNIMICDFGYSKSLEDDSVPNSRVGTPQYLAPEVLLANPKIGYDAKKADVWSCGVFLFAMLAGHYPFGDGSRNAHREDQLSRLIQKILTGKFTVPSRISWDAQDLLRKMIHGDHNGRITMEEIKIHPWFSVDLGESFEKQWNSSGEEQNPSTQSDGEIEWIVREAKKSSFSNQSLDALVQAAMKENASKEKSTEKDGDWVMMEPVKTH
ncbi:hypothetical protein BSKO_13591 [Bryopsis sp. KO-2023]|nr:hypothetical protein BSKO_13591 [Bryopsis sp. KO-2023]